MWVVVPEPRLTVVRSLEVLGKQVLRRTGSRFESEEEGLRADRAIPCHRLWYGPPPPAPCILWLGTHFKHVQYRAILTVPELYSPCACRDE